MIILLEKKNVNRCEYQGYRKKDTMNHINFVHNAGVTMETLSNFTETVSKAVDEESVAKLNELKRTQLKIKRKMARERNKKQREEKQKVEVKQENDDTAQSEPKESENASTSESESKTRRSSLPESLLKMNNNISSPTLLTKIKVEDVTENNMEETSPNACKSPLSSPTSSSSSSIPNVSRHGKVIKNSPSDSESKDQSHQRPIRNRIKPVRKDFLYDLSDLLKKEADAYREQVFQSSNVTVKRELRKRAMSTHTREMPNMFDNLQPSKKLCSPESFISPLPPLPHSEAMASPSKFKDQRNRRMSVFVSSPRTSQLYSAPQPQQQQQQPRSPPYKPPNAGTHKNVGQAHKMAVTVCETNQAAMYEPKFLWTVNFQQEQIRLFATPKFSVPTTSTSNISQPSTSTSKITQSLLKPNPVAMASNVSAASSILQKLSGRGIVTTIPAQTIATVPQRECISLLKPKNFEEKPRGSTTAELCKKFELINVTNINESEFDIPDSRVAINLNPGRNNLVSLALGETDSDVCVLQECSGAESDDDDDDDEDEDEDEEEGQEDEEADYSDDSEPKLEIESEESNKKSKRGRKSKKSSTTSAQRRLTVMQRLQDIKIRKSREQLFKRLINQQSENEAESPSSSSEFDLFSET